MNNEPEAVRDLLRGCAASRSRAPLRIAFACACLAVGAAITSAGEGPDTTLFRVILKDGTALTSYGEYARVGDHVVFSMPFGPVATRPQLQLISLPSNVVDWETTERYSDSVRYARYVETRAEADYATLTGEIARRLNELSLVTDPTSRLEMAESARRLLMDWPASHFGYRSKDIREMVALLDEAISDLRAKAGARAFDLSLVAIIEPPTMPLLPDPTPAQMVDQALAAARLADNSVERTSLLRSTIAYIDQSMSALSRDWAKRSRAAASAALKTEAKTNQAYARLRDKSVASANRLASKADVGGIANLLERVKQSDAKFGHLRPEEIESLVGHLNAKLDAARRLRLARDQWALRSEALLAYRDQVTKVISAFEQVKQPLAEIRSLSGPEARSLKKVRQRVTSLSQRLAAIVPPHEVASFHALLISACNLAGQAIDLRERAVLSQDMRMAWDASAASSGATMLLTQAWTDMQALFKPPELR